ncbi:MAG: hypothetical protein JW844_02530 [Candidatus Omnitrophica bacterium]|nr:hypothetical protein [Candidatus Omnitrophota bacterium]
MDERDAVNKEPRQEVDSVIKEGKFFAIVGYIGVLCLIPLLLKKDNRFALFHGKQGLVLFIGWVAAGVLNIVPVLGQIIWVIAAVVFGLLSLAGILQVLMNNYWKMPVVGDIAEKISL